MLPFQYVLGTAHWEEAPGKWAREDPGVAGGTMYPVWPENTLGRGRSGFSLWTCCLWDVTLRKQQKMEMEFRCR